MQRRARQLGGLAAGATVGGLLVGAAEGLYRGVPGTYALLLYGACWAVAAVVGFPVWGLARRKRGRGSRPFAWGLSAALGLSILVLGQFILFRDVFVEAPSRRWVAVGIAAAAAVTAVWLVRSLVRAVERRLMAERLGGIWLWAIPVVVLVAFAIRTRAGDDALPETSPAASRALGGSGVVLVVADALRADALGVYGAGPHRGAPPSPSLDALAGGGRVFTRATAQASWTRPAVASILTSRHVSGHDTMAKNAVLPAELPTVATALAGAGVATAAVVTNYNLEPAYGFARGFADYRYLPPARYLGAPAEASRLAAYNVYRLLRERFFTAGRQARFFYRSAETVNAQAMQLLDRIGDGRFFLYLHYMEPHDPYFAATGESYARVSTPRPPLAWASNMKLAYGDEVQRLDRALGELVAGLRARGLLERTTVMVVADHGEELGDHGGFYHGLTLYQEMLHVPLVLAGPGIPAGEDSSLARQIDVAPTILGRFGVTPPASWEGRDLLGATEPPSSSLAEEDHEGNELRALTSGTEKLILANDDNPRGLAPVELYDLAADPREAKSLDRPAAVAELRRQLDAAVAQARKGGARAVAREPDAASEAELRALGYVQ